MMRALLLLLPVMALPSCITSYGTRGSPVPFGADCSQVLSVGGTSRTEVLELFGAPTKIQPTRDGETFRYLYVRNLNDGVNVGFSALWGLLSLSLFKSENKREDTENLTIFFDQEGVLTDWSYTPAFSSAK